MADKMIDPDFDPLMDLEILKQRLQQLEANFARLVDAHNNQTQLVKQVAPQNTELLEFMAMQRHMVEAFNAASK